MPRASERGSGPSLAAAALELARDGWEVFPCGPDKSPRTRGGFHDASSDEDVVAGWDWKGALIGAAIPIGQVVLDVDPRNGGDATMQALKEAGHKLPRTRVVKTGGDGTHYYFRVPPDVELRAHLGEGVDVKRAGRGYVIVPPSPGYRTLRDDKPAKLPTWLLEALAAPEGGGSSGEAADAKFMPWEHGTAYGTAALERVLGRLAVAPEGGRNDELNKAAFSVAQLVAGGELEGEQAQAALEEVATRAGLRAGETRKTIASGWEAGFAEPRQAPPRDSSRKVFDDKNLAPPEADADDGARFWLNWEVDEEPPAYLLDPIIPENAYVLVYGATEASKSMAFVALGAEASRRGIKTTIYSLENPPHVDRDRVRRLAPDPEHFRMTNEPLDLNDPRQFQALVEREKAWGTRLVMLDTYSHAFNSRSEDGNAKAIEFARHIRYLMHVVGCAVVLIDHTGYAQEDEPRDASAKRQQVDVAVLMKKEGEWKPGRPARFRMENKKSARFGNPFLLTGEIKDGKDRALALGWIGKAPEWAE